MEELNSPSPVVLTTARLFAREFVKEDIASVYEYASDIDNCAFMEWAPESIEGVAAYIDRRLASQIVSPRTSYDLAVCLKSTGELIGSVSLNLDKERRSAEIGWILNKKYWHKGYAKEAAEGFMRFGFLGLDLHRIYAKCDTENKASYTLMEKLGMRREACFVKDNYTTVRQVKGWRSTYCYAVLQKEYLNRLADGSYDPLSS